MLVNPKIHLAGHQALVHSKWTKKHLLFISNCKQSELEYKGQQRRLWIKDQQAEFPISYVFRTETDDSDGRLVKFFKYYVKFK